MPDSHVLDRPTWNALCSGWAPWAQGDALAKRMALDYSPFAAPCDLSDAAVTAFGALIPAGCVVYTIDSVEVPTPAGLRVVKSAPGVQMVACDIAPPDPDAAIVSLGDADAAEMMALAELTQPGPFGPKTHLIGDFVGIRIDGRLAAMAGERMRLDGFSEVSGVCAHPDARGRGLASVLIRHVAHRIGARGETPFLHAWADNARAIALYETLGFAQRRVVIGTGFARD